MPAPAAPLPPDLASLPGLFQAVIDTSLTGIALLQPVYGAGQPAPIIDFTYRYLNPAAQRMLRLPGCPAESLLTRHSPTEVAEIFAFYQEAFRAAEAQHHELTQFYDGLDTQFHLVAQRSSDVLTVSFTDNANPERGAVEQALRASQAREQEALATTERERNLLQAVLMQAPVAIGLFQGEQQVVATANAQLCAMWGYAPEQVLGRPLLEGVPELRGQGFAELLAEVARTRVPFVGRETAARLRQHDRLHTRYFNFVYQPLVDAAGDLLGVLDIATDVTEQVHAYQQVQTLNEELAAINEELHASNEEYSQANAELTLTQQQLQHLNQELEARVAARTAEAQVARAEAEHQRGRLEQVFRRAPAAICIFGGPDWVYEFVNPGYQQLFYGRELLGKPLLEALPEMANQPLLQALRDVYTTGVPYEDQEVLVPLARTAGGLIENIYFDLTYQARFDEQGQIDGCVCYAYDVTGQVHARQQVQELNEELAVINEEMQVTNEELNYANIRLVRTNTDLDNFIYTASHDLKVPISNIEGLLLALQHELPAANRVGDVPTLLHLMQDSVERFKRTITHLTDVSRLQKEYDQPASHVSLADIVNDVRLDLLPLLTAADARLEIAVPTYVLLTFSEKNLRSVVYNLLSNALKYRHPDRVPHISLAYQAQGEYQVLVVQDNGLGLDLAQGQDKLFAMFQRLHTHVEGSGLGLYMVKRMVENAGGHVEVQSQLGRGSTFSIYFLR